MNKKTENAFCAIHHAAWACDDMKDNKNATRCRDLAIPLIDKLISGKSQNKENLKLMRADLLRRAGHFEKVITDYSSTVFENEIMDKVRKFQIKKAEQKDTLCYTVEEAVK